MTSPYTRSFWMMAAKLLLIVIPLGSGLMVGAYHLKWWLAAHMGWNLPRFLVMGVSLGLVVILFRVIAGKEYDTLVAETAARKAGKTNNKEDRC